MQMTKKGRKVQDKVLVVEDDDGLRGLLEEELKDGGLRVRSVGTAASAWKSLESWGPDLVVSDLRLPGDNGLELLARVRTLPVPPSFVMITAFGTVPQAVEALKQGADDFLTKPLDLDHFMLCVNRTLENRRLRSEVQRFRALIESKEDFHGMIGRSAAMCSLFAILRKVAVGGGPVLISGESGVGKELVARAVHQESPRRVGPFIAVNCAGIPAELLESEFFGHAAGAFTGAGSGRQGLFAEAEGGTLLLDEIAEMPLELQAKLLRILQDGRVRPVGANREQQIDVRILAATNRDLEEQVRNNRFREDLYFRLETFCLHVPPLRERHDDLDLLAARFIEFFSARLNREVAGLTEAALDCLRGYPFPGNVRELRNAMERAVVFCSGREIGLEHLPDRMRRRSSGGYGSGEELQLLAGNGPLPTLEELANRYARWVVERLDGNKRRAAEVLGIGRATLYRRLGIRDGEAREL
jgi:DNA-binding NtrC family response regulator